MLPVRQAVRCQGQGAKAGARENRRQGQHGEAGGPKSGKYLLLCRGSRGVSSPCPRKDCGVRGLWVPTLTFTPHPLSAQNPTNPLPGHSKCHPSQLQSFPRPVPCLPKLPGRGERAAASCEPQDRAALSTRLPWLPGDGPTHPTRALRGRKFHKISGLKTQQGQLCGVGIPFDLLSVSLFPVCAPTRQPEEGHLQSQYEWDF